ncbi:MAG: GyrI-like domain-containing protein [Methylocapsa sp.]|nr:GyrI-like domain-containing protein [Methylocapsa sp.]
MKNASTRFLLGVSLTFSLLLAAVFGSPRCAFAQVPGAAPPGGESGAGPPPAAPPAGQSEPPPRIPSDATVVTLELAARPVAYLHASGKWEDGFKTVRGELAKVQAAIKKAGLTPAGPPFALFLDTGETGFEFDAMVPIAAKPPADELPDGVKIGESPSGKAIKFLHRGSWDEIDSTYDLITAFLDEKGLDAQNRYIEEYLTDTTAPDDANLEADIYVLLK